jgi:hypothetical protein
MVKILIFSRIFLEIIFKVSSFYAENEINIVSEDNRTIASVENYQTKFRGFYLYKNDIKFFPLNVKNFIKSVKIVIIENGRLTKIIQNDLKPFDELIYLSLHDNDITNIEKDTFKFNTKLVYISISWNKLAQIDLNVFDHLKALAFLYLHSNEPGVCVSGFERNGKATLRLIEEVMKKCAVK